MKKYTLLTLLLLMYCLLRAQSIYVCPDTTNVTNPGEFDVCIFVDEEVQDFRGFRVVMAYDSEVMTFVDAERGEVLDGYGSYWWRVFDEGPDSLHIECMGFGAGISVSGPGSILTMTFHSEATGLTPLHFKEFTLYSVDGLPMTGVESHDGAVDIKLPVGVYNIHPTVEDLSVSPNPFVDRALVSWTQQEPGKSTLQLINMQGTIAAQWTIGTSEAGKNETYITMDVEPGVYVLRVICGREDIRKKVVVR